MKKFFKLFSVVLLLIINICALFFTKPQTVKQIASNETYGKIVVTVLEENTNKPIDNAIVCLIESREYVSTNKNGLTNILKVPIIRNTNFDYSLKRNWGEITLLVYKPGYADHICFYQSVPVKQTRLGIIVRLSPIFSSTDTAPTITTNTPDKTWVKELIRLYKK